jgi:glycosyltransferase involved in cell wall biosynthesis
MIAGAASAGMTNIVDVKAPALLARPENRISALRLALVSGTDPTNPEANSGAPAGLFRALSELCETVPISGVLPRSSRLTLRVAVAAALRPRDLTLRSAIGPARSRAALGRVAVSLRSRQIASRLAAAGALDACVQFGSDYILPYHLTRVTLDDLTVIQALSSHAWPDLADKANARSWQLRQRAGYLRARACCAMSHWAARSIVEDYGIPSTRVHVVGLGANHEVSPPPDRDWSTPRFLFVGNDWKRKNGDAVVRAFREVRARVPAARLAIVGAHPRLEDGGITCYGRLSLGNPVDKRRVAELFGSSTCLVLPSWNEPTGTVHAEAAAAGLPSIGTIAGGVVTVIGDSGVLVDPGCDDDLVAAMLRVADPVVAQRLGAAARARAPLFTWRKVAERLLRALAPPDLDRSSLAEFL